MKHSKTKSMQENFAKLETRLMRINDPHLGKHHIIGKMLKDIIGVQKPVLVIATGGSKVVASFLKTILENYGHLICEVIEPRDYFYKDNIKCYSSLIIVSASGKTNGLEKILNDFDGSKYLLCEDDKKTNYNVISWGNTLYEKEQSFISLVTSLGPITLLLDAITFKDEKITPEKIEQINTKIKELYSKAQKKINNIKTKFANANLVQILSGYDTISSCLALESNLVETGLSAVTIHDKGSYCHGRSNLIFNYPQSYVVYLKHQTKPLDELIINLIKKNYANLLILTAEDLNENNFWKEYYLLMQVYFLSKKIAEDKKRDLTMPEYNCNVLPLLYNFKGEM